MRNSKLIFMLVTGLALLIALVSGQDPGPGTTGPQATLTPPLKVRVGTDGLAYVWIPPGTFQMGCSPDDNECQDDEKPAHQVTITRGFWMGQTEVTVEAYKRFAAATGRGMPPEPMLVDRSLNPGWIQGSQPIMGVTWDDAAAYSRWAGGRLPTEAEWEYAARSGTSAARYGVLGEIAWYADNSGKSRLDSASIVTGGDVTSQIEQYAQRMLANGNGPREVGRKAPNAWGLYDMLGNAHEWVADWYLRDYFLKSPAEDPLGPVMNEETKVPTSQHALRGGSWYNLPRALRASNRGWLVSGTYRREFYVGFRCVLEDPLPPQKRLTN